MERTSRTCRTRGIASSESSRPWASPKETSSGCSGKMRSSSSPRYVDRRTKKIEERAMNVLYMVTVEIDPQAEAAWDAWNTEHHTPEVLREPGFVRAAKYRLEGD